MNKTDEQQSGSGKKLALAGLITSAAAGAVYLYGKGGRRRRQRLRGWMLKMKGDILNRLEQTEELTRKRYEEIIAEVADKYARQKHVRSQEVERLSRKLKDRWEDIRQAVSEHIAYIKEDGKQLPEDSSVTAAVGEAVRDIARRRDIDAHQDIPELLEEIIDSGIQTAIDSWEYEPSADGEGELEDDNT